MRPRRVLRWSRDLLALAVVFAYAFLAWSAETSSALPGVALDPVLTAVRERGTLRVATDVGFRPFSDMRDDEFVGYDIDLAREVAQRLGLRVAFVPTGFDGLYDALTSDNADVIASALPYAPELGYRARFSSVYFDAGLVLLVPTGSSITGAGDLATRRLGVELGSDGDALARRISQDTPDVIVDASYDAPAAVIAALEQGVVDAAIVDNVAALTATQRDDGLRIAAALTSAPYVLAMPPNAFQLQADVNEVLETLRNEGFFAELNQRWFR